MMKVFYIESNAIKNVCVYTGMTIEKFYFVQLVLMMKRGNLLCNSHENLC